MSVLACTTGLGQAGSPADLEKGFGSPPHSARVHTWWHWMNGNVTREGITADLEAMKQIGLGGAQIFNVSEGIPDGPVKFMSPEWRALVKHAATEAERVGIELCMHNCAGWSSSGGPWVTPENAMQTLVFSETPAKGPGKFAGDLKQPDSRLNFYRDIAVLAFPTPKDGAFRIKDLRPKAGFEERYGLLPHRWDAPEGSVIQRGSVVDLTAALKSGQLEWDVPAGDWTILRIGHTPTGKDNHPSPESGRGLEVDKFSRAAFDTHWEGMMGPVLRDLGPLAGKVLNNSLIDSYEVGHQNWTPKFREEFLNRRGYDPLALLPVLTGRVIDGAEASERFLWDFRRTIADLFADNYYTYFAELCRKNGLQVSIEPYDGPFECLLNGRDADIPMGEFWVGGGERSSIKLAASVAHTYGRTLAGAESFTAFPDAGKWQNHPYGIKAEGDLIYCGGINRFIMHRYAHQPWLNIAPGMTMGQWGTHFERTITWWEQGAPWVEYLARCQFMLQQGLFGADVCYFSGEAVPADAPYKPELKAKGYDYDAINADVLLRRASVKDGKIVLSDGMSYHVLVLPESEYMTPKVLAKIRDLVRQGATVIGPAPRTSPSLGDMGGGDTIVASMAKEVWDDCDGKAVTEHAFGKGRVVCGKSPEEVLAAQGIGPDCEFRAPAPPKMAWIRRTAGASVIYFVSNQKPRVQEVDCSFRVTGMAPELWDAETGKMAPAPLWREESGRTVVPLRFEPAGSTFVVFRPRSGAADHFVKAVTPRSAEEAAPKIEIRKAVYEAKDGTGGADVTAKVAAMVAGGETLIPANNSSYGDPAYMHLKHLRLEFSLDGKALTKTADENTTLDLVGWTRPARPAAWSVAQGAEGAIELLAFEAGEYSFERAQGNAWKTTVPALPAPIAVGGPWTLSFPPNLGAPAGVTLPKLISWTDHEDPGVKYFSGSAEYRTSFEVPAAAVGANRLLTLDLGNVKCFAEVTLNGKKLAVLWKAPFAVDVSKIAQPGTNELSVRVTNLWVNRLVGDEQLPDDSEWNGRVLKGWPKWLTDGSPRPSQGRVGFTTWKHFSKESPVLESGLLGPVVIRPGVRVPAPAAGSAGQ